MSDQQPQLTDYEKQVVEKLNALLNDKKVHIFSESEVEIIKEMMDIYAGMRSWGKLAGIMRNAVIWLGVMFGAYYAFKEWVIAAAKATGRFL